MKKDPQVFLKHIRDSIIIIEESTSDLTEEGFLSSVQIQDALVRRLEIIGEAVRNIPEDFRDLHPQVPWKKIAGMRNKIIHEYFDIDLDLVWDVVKKEIPVLKKEIKKLIV